MFLFTVLFTAHALKCLMFDVYEMFFSTLKFFFAKGTTHPDIKSKVKLSQKLVPFALVTNLANLIAKFLIIEILGPLGI